MTIHEQRFLDKSEPDENGDYDYYYSGVNYCVSDVRGEWRARMYDDEVDCLALSFVESRLEDALFSGYKPRFFREIPYKEEYFEEVIRAFYEKGFRRITLTVWSGDGLIDLSRVKGCCRDTSRQWWQFWK